MTNSKEHRNRGSSVLFVSFAVKLVTLGQAGLGRLAVFASKSVFCEELVMFSMSYTREFICLVRMFYLRMSICLVLYDLVSKPIFLFLYDLRKNIYF